MISFNWFNANKFVACECILSDMLQYTVLSYPMHTANTHKTYRKVKWSKWLTTFMAYCDTKHHFKCGIGYFWLVLGSPLHLLIRTCNLMLDPAGTINNKETAKKGPEPNFPTNTSFSWLDLVSILFNYRSATCTQRSTVCCVEYVIHNMSLCCQWGILMSCTSVAGTHRTVHSLYIAYTVHRND